MTNGERAGAADPTVVGVWDGTTHWQYRILMNGYGRARIEYRWQRRLPGLGWRWWTRWRPEMLYVGVGEYAETDYDSVGKARARVRQFVDRQRDDARGRARWTLVPAEPEQEAPR